MFLLIVVISMSEQQPQHQKARNHVAQSNEPPSETQHGEAVTSQAENSKDTDVKGEYKNFQLVLCTCPDKATASSIAENIVAQRLVACVNILPGIESIYQWQGNVESAQEHLMLIKTHADKFPALKRSIASMHPYEVPEIIAIDINQGLPEYMQWLKSCILG